MHIKRSNLMSVCLYYFVQPSVGDGDQSCYAEVPQPNEPQCGWGGRPGQECGHSGAAPQQKTTKH